MQDGLALYGPDRLHHGDVIVTNSSTSFFPVDAGTVIRAVYEGLGAVTATLLAVLLVYIGRHSWIRFQRGRAGLSSELD